MAQGTLLDIAKLNGSDKVVGLVEENLTYAPELAIVPARTVKGTSYRTTSRTTYPGVGFRSANGGTTYTKSTFLNRQFECYIFAANIRADVAVASAYEDGPEAYKAIEASGVMKQSLIDIGSQFFYGTAADTLGFPGIAAFHAAFTTELGSTAQIVLDSGGTTSSTGSSVYGIKFGDQGVQFIFGNNSVLTLGAWFQQMVNDGTTGSDYLAEVASMNAWIGLQAANPYCIGRLKDSTEDSGKGVTDARLAELLSKYPVGYKPDRWFMTRRSAFQLQASRSATSVTNSAPKQNNGKDIFAEEPVQACGIPITVTDSLTNTETLT